MESAAGEQGGGGRMMPDGSTGGGLHKRVVLGSLELEHRKLLGMLANPSQRTLSQEDDKD